MKTKTLARYTIAPLFVAAILFTQSAHAGWVQDWIKCSEDCGWICDCSGGELAFKPGNPKEQKAFEEITKVMGSYKANMKSLSPEAKSLLKKLDKKGTSKSP